MKARERYTVTFERDEAGWWVTRIREVPGCMTQGRTIAIRMLVDDVVADANMDRQRHTQPISRGQHADVLVRERPLGDGLTDRFTEPHLL